MLLYGPPGCGKTHIVGAAVAAAGLRFVGVKGPEVLNKYIGASEAAVRDLFRREPARISMSTGCTSVHMCGGMHVRAPACVLFVAVGLSCSPRDLRPLVVDLPRTAFPGLHTHIAGNPPGVGSHLLCW